MPPQNDEANLARIRENQRRSRARRKEYQQELEQRVRIYEEKGVEASAEVQRAARHVAEENRKLRALLRHHGISQASIDAYLRSGDASMAAVAASSAETGMHTLALEQLLVPRAATSLSPLLGPSPRASISSAASVSATAMGAGSGIRTAPPSSPDAEGTSRGRRPSRRNSSSGRSIGGQRPLIDATSTISSSSPLVLSLGTHQNHNSQGQDREKIIGMANPQHHQRLQQQKQQQKQRHEHHPNHQPQLTAPADGGYHLSTTAAAYHHHMATTTHSGDATTIPIPFYGLDTAASADDLAYAATGEPVFFDYSVSPQYFDSAATSSVSSAGGRLATTSSASQAAAASYYATMPGLLSPGPGGVASYSPSRACPACLAGMGCQLHGFYED